jgi:hypothetical protein
VLMRLMRGGPSMRLAAMAEERRAAHERGGCAARAVLRWRLAAERLRTVLGRVAALAVLRGVMAAWKACARTLCFLRALARHVVACRLRRAVHWWHAFAVRRSRGSGGGGDVPRLNIHRLERTLSRLCTSRAGTPTRSRSCPRRPSGGADDRAASSSDRPASADRTRPAQPAPREVRGLQAKLEQQRRCRLTAVAFSRPAGPSAISDALAAPLASSASSCVAPARSEDILAVHRRHAAASTDGSRRAASTDEPEPTCITPAPDAAVRPPSAGGSAATEDWPGRDAVRAREVEVHSARPEQAEPAELRAAVDQERESLRFETLRATAEQARPSLRSRGCAVPWRVVSLGSICVLRCRTVGSSACASGSTRTCRRARKGNGRWRPASKAYTASRQASAQ